MLERGAQARPRHGCRSRPARGGAARRVGRGGVGPRTAGHGAATAREGERKPKPQLVPDDQVWAKPSSQKSLIVSAPDTIAGKLEVRGLGIVTVPFLAQAKLVLVCNLV